MRCQGTYKGYLALLAKYFPRSMIWIHSKIIYTFWEKYINGMEYRTMKCWLWDHILSRPRFDTYLVHYENVQFKVPKNNLFCFDCFPA